MADSKLSESQRKKRRQLLSKKSSAARIYIGAEFGRWSRLKEEQNLKWHADVAKILLDSYYKTTTRQPPTSTPATQGKHFTVPFLVSEISATSESDNQQSNTQRRKRLFSETTLTASGSGEEEPALKRTLLTEDVDRKRKAKPIQMSSFVDPFNLSIEVTSSDNEEEHSDDPDYEPSFSMCAVLPDDVNAKYEEVAFEEIAFGLEAVDDEPQQEAIEEDLGPGVQRVWSENDCRQLTTETTCLTFVKQLKSLAGTSVNKCSQADCSQTSNIRIEEEYIGSALYLKWICGSGHLVHRWCSQPVLNRRMHSGDFLTALAIVTSGNNFSKVALMAKCLNMKFMTPRTFFNIQRTYIVPTVDDQYKEQQQGVIESFRDKDLIVLGDGRNDSPGHSAQYCSYTLMEMDTKKIITLQTLDKRTTDRKSVAMEKKGFEVAMAELQDSGMHIKEVVTDAHTGIGAVMKRTFPDIKHSHDIWHAAKNLGKKLMKVTKKKSNSVLVPWQKDIVNHFWFACQKANTYEEFYVIWRSVLSHICNEHEWALGHGAGLNRCLHEPLSDEERDKPWLSPIDHADVLKELAKVVLDRRFLGKVHYYLNYRSTAELEAFHQLILMYCAKRFAYTPPVYRMRNRLAVIDHNYNADRLVRRNKKGEIMYKRYYQKKSQRWTVSPLRAQKRYGYIQEIAWKALVKRVTDKKGMNARVELDLDDPRHLGRLAPSTPPATRKLVEEKRSRF